MQKVFFMAGLPRSGGTLISSILNQNPDIYSSANSVLANTLGSVYNQYSSNENLDVDQRENIYSVLDGIIPLFYECRKERYIIDKNFFWLERIPWSILEKHLKNEIRVICPVRNIMHMIASWNRMCEEDAENRHDKDMVKVDRSNRSMPDKRADFFMNGNRVFEKIDGINVALHNVPENILLVDYDKLIEDPKDTINTICGFLGISEYNHNFTKLSTPHQYNDYWGVKNQHVVKDSIDRQNYNLEEIFSKETIEKYSNLEFWKHH